jgi:hypothetical protein
MCAQVRIAAFINIVILLCSGFAQAEKPVKFYKEETTITLQENSVSVQGFYFFENRSDFELDVSLLYPFYIDPFQLFPRTIRVLDPVDPITFEEKEKGIQWSQHFEPTGIETVLVHYDQEIKQTQATYVLEKSSWNSKVDNISILVEAPLSFLNMSLSIEADSSNADGKHQYFYITRRYFTPEQDLAISWE